MNFDSATYDDDIDNIDKKYLKISQVNKHIYFGSCKSAIMETDDFKELNIDVIINCAKELEHPKQSKYIIENYTIIDGDQISMLENMDQINDQINKYLLQEKKIYIHCVRGISRSPAIIIYYLMTHRKFTYDRAYDLLKTIRPIIEIDPDFEDILINIEK